MQIVSIEPTPSPNAMKVTLDQHLESGIQKTYNKEQAEHAPVRIQKILQISGVKSVFHTADFLSIERESGADWQSILAQTKEAFGESSAGLTTAESDDGFGEVKLYVQLFRGIPMQIRVRTAMEEVRESLSDRFVNTAMEAGLASPNLIRERKLVDYGVRYGEPEEIAQEVLEELEAAYDDARLQDLKQRAEKLGEGEEPVEKRREIPFEEVIEAMNDQDWRKRYAALEQMKLESAALPALKIALQDERASIRRLAVVDLGELGEEEVLPSLYIGLRDSNPSVRRTAGDALSDIGNAAAIGPMIESLKDSNRIVRWRAARFLYEVGDETALDELKVAVDDPEFEVSLQARIAIERIERGEEAAGTIWQQMARAREQS